MAKMSLVPGTFVVTRIDHDAKRGDLYYTYGPYDEKYGEHLIECCGRILSPGDGRLRVTVEPHAVYAVNHRDERVVSIVLTEVRSADSDICEGIET